MPLSIPKTLEVEERKLTQPQGVAHGLRPIMILSPLPGRDCKVGEKRSCEEPGRDR